MSDVVAGGLVASTHNDMRAPTIANRVVLTHTNVPSYLRGVGPSHLSPPGPFQLIGAKSHFLTSNGPSNLTASISLVLKCSRLQ